MVYQRLKNVFFCYLVICQKKKFSSDILLYGTIWKKVLLKVSTNGIYVAIVRRGIHKKFVRQLLFYVPIWEDKPTAITFRFGLLSTIPKPQQQMFI